MGLAAAFSAFSSVSLAAEGSASSSRTFEVNPFFGVLLPSGIDGLESSLQGVGVRANYMINAPAGIEVGSFFWKHNDDSGSTFDGGLYYELPEEVKPYFSAGLHYSYFKIEAKRTDLGVCTTTNCETEGGSKIGVYAGGGVIVPISEKFPVKAGMRFYKGPGIWILFDVGIGIRL